MAIEMQTFGDSGGRTVRAFILHNTHGLTMKVIELGAIISALHLPDRTGHFADVVLGFDTLGNYRAGHPCFGAVCGRVANRIADGRFVLDGQTYQLPTPAGKHHLHGADHAFHTVIWTGEPRDDDAVTLTYHAADGEDGFPGTLEAAVTYRLGDDNRLHIDMEATSDAPTLCNLAQHTYWNLAGHDSGSVLGHALQLHASQFTRFNDETLPTGETASVDATPFDFRNAKPLGRDIAALINSPFRGYDQNFVVDGEPGALRPAATLVDPKTGRAFELHTTQPGIQLYTANFLDGTLVGKADRRYGQHGAVCLETQHPPDAIHHPHFPQPILRPGETYRHRMRFDFTTH